jgi:glycosyltransferase A (GT-A) superfamily protein (DUF2064 family)
MNSSELNGSELNSTSLSSTAIAVFVKTPGLSPVKTRLAASIGTPDAEHLYRLCVSAIEQTLLGATQDLSISPFWAVGETAGLSNALWQGFESIHTGDGGLGERQHHIYQTLQARYQRVILVGADSPQLSVKLLKEAIKALDKHTFAIGPAVDGGYYLFAGRAPVPKNIWTSVIYSAADTAEQLCAQLPSPAVELERITDVDTINDLKVLKSELLAETALSHKQEEIIRWIDKLEG